MPADQVPSDAEVEAMIRRQEARAFNRSEPSVDLGAKEVASMFRALLGERQAVPARIAAAVAHFERIHRDAIAWGSVPACVSAVERGKGVNYLAEQLGYSAKDCADHLAAQLAAAEARGIRKAATAKMPEPWELEPAAIFLEHVEDDETGSAQRVAAFLRSLIPTPPAGGADDAG